MNDLQSLLNRISTIVTKNNQILDATGGRFNVFQVIGVTTDETRLHSAFIHELLNVKGTHGLGDLPLKAFIKICLDEDFDFQTTKASSKVELSIGGKSGDEGGRIDIIITDECNYAIIIENKIYAGDQDFQMLRYYNYSKKFSSSRLIYLTLDGKIPSEFSTGNQSFDFVALSYKFEITNWLTECKKIAIDFPLVREAISHYINLIKHLTNTSIMDEMNKEIIELVLQSPENVKNAFELEKALTDVKIKIQWEFWKQLEKSLIDNGLVLLGEDDKKRVKHWKVEGYYEKLRNKDIHYGLWVEIFNKNGVTIHWGCEIQDNIYFGFTLEKDGKGGISNLEENELFRQAVTECDELYRTDNENWLGWQYTSPILGFREFNSQAIFDLSNERNRKNITIQIVEKAIHDITFILNRLS